MSKINILSSDVYNRIAAGEVVERPRSVVKELVENSIDAGAKNIAIEIISGGMSSIKVSDDGSGISKEDLSLAFMPHATSKIRNETDLNNITSLGFRGEALASIASVADVKMTSRLPGEELGNYINIDNGKITGEDRCGSALGTSVSVENLFEKIPARKKFLSKPSHEEAEISNLIMRLIMANYNIAFRYSADGKPIYFSDGKGMESAVFSVYGKDIFDNLLHFEHVMSDITLKGYVGKPGFSKHNRNFQTLIVNGRYIANQELSYVIQNAYREFLMQRQFPVYILYLDIPGDMLDVNVHPNKMEVRFVSFDKLKGVVYKSISEVIRKNHINPLKTDFDEKLSFEDLSSEAAAVRDIGSDESNDMQQGMKVPAESFTNSDFGQVGRRSLFNWPGSKQDRPPHFTLEEKSRLYNRVFDNSNIQLNDNSTNIQDVMDRNLVEYFKSDEDLEQQLHAGTGVINGCLQTDMGIDTDNKIAGKVFNTYIAVEKGDNLFIIDQHAAHERLLYDLLVEQYNLGDVIVQDLIVPYIFDLGHTDAAILEENVSTFAKYGFNISKLSGNSFSIGSVPLSCIDINSSDFIGCFFEDLSGQRIRSSDFIANKIALAACKAAVKGKMDLSSAEINMLLEKMKNSETLFCPHGRPVIIKVTKKEIEKLFKRIV